MKGKTAQRLVLVLAVVAALAPVAESAIVADVLRRGASDNDPPVMAPNPLGEDELCFADRTHEYNMIPEGIVGAGYVQVANNDKTVGDYALEITLLEDATVYLFLDNRLGYGETPGGDPNLPPDIHAAEMGWVAAMGFTDTGTDIGIDESGDGDINQWSSVYVLDATVGTIRLLQQNDVTNPGGRNMYGVAVAMSPSFLIMGDGWAAALESGTVRGMTEREWEESMSVLDPNGGTIFFTPELYYYGEPGGPGQPDEPGMVMAWGTPEQVRAGPTASAWTYSYPVDPDLTGRYIVVTVFPPVGVTQVSLMLTEEYSGYSAVWKWGVGDKWSGQPLLEETWNLVVLDMDGSGAGAAYPDKVTYTPQTLSKHVDKTKIATITFSEVYKGSALPGFSVKPPGGSQDIAWNSWRELYVTKDPKIASSTAGYVVASQTPHYTVTTASFWGWDTDSVFNHHHPAPAIPRQLPADDFMCINYYGSDLEVRRIRWWGSFKDWTGKTPPADPGDMPDAFILSIWSSDSPGSWDRPKEVLWQHSCNPAPIYKGWERDPHSTSKNVPVIGDSCFEYSCEIPPDERWQRPGGPATKYWLSIQARYSDPSPPSHPWGWKTRPNDGSNSSAVHITSILTGGWPPEAGATWNAGYRIAHPQSISWNLAFELVGELKP